MGLPCRDVRDGYIRSSVAGLILLLLVPTDLPGQAVRGRVFDHETELPVIGASVLLLDLQEHVLRTVLTDSTGSFLLNAPRAGQFRLRVQRIGYETINSPAVEISRDTLEVSLIISTRAIPLAPLTIVADRPSTTINTSLELRGFYKRKDHWGKDGMGFGHFLERDEIQRRSPSRVSDIVRTISGIRVIGAGGLDQLIRTRSNGYRCDPAVYLDGHLFASGSTIDQWISPHSIAAIEIYPGLGRPGEFSRGCGAIVLWTGGGE